ncbi:MOSC domain-containing protein [Agitococcus lubricus]|uniref:MOSC domain-containing protein n=1 Tax=Agitococcus lubricus TaxID=1077255 RepID=A0A2T5J1W0_9GAMM|nr:MOSC N-terminal beta barrel domain-containing protein [Agitococcus lubricus]PTQ90430.1 hypothetical protein C8N29_103183 [Agitococcus lubricus]
MSAFISQLAIYPLKSAAAVALEQATLTELGLAWDRRWLLVDSQGQFITQRQYPSMAQIRARVESGRLLVSAPHQLDLSIEPTVLNSLYVTIWQDRVLAHRVSQQADQWFSDYLNIDVQLVFFPEYGQRVVDEAWAGVGHQTAFSDGFPLLVLTQASLDALSQHWQQTVDWRRFRPNIVIGGDMAAYSEDQWTGLKVGDIELALVKPCSRCVIPSIDPDTAQKDSSLNKVLATYRRRTDGKIYVGQNAIIRQLGRGLLRVGMPVELLF